jgi:hypothetical protein
VQIVVVLPMTKERTTNFGIIFFIICRCLNLVNDQRTILIML